MATLPNFAAAGYRFETVPDLSRLETRERLSQSAVEGLFRIAEKWRVSPETVGELLGGVPRSSVYKLRSASGKPDGVVTLQGSEVAYAFVQEALPKAEKEGLDLEVYYVASAELFDLLSPAQREKIYPQKAASAAIGITGFTLPTMHRWITSERGRAATLHPFQKGHYLGSGQADMVMREAGLDGKSQLSAIKKFIKSR